MRIIERIKDYYNNMSWQAKTILFGSMLLAAEIRGCYDGYQHGYKEGRADERAYIESRVEGTMEALDTLEKVLKVMGYDQKIDGEFLRDYIIYKKQLEMDKYRTPIESESEKPEKHQEPRKVHYNDFPC